MTDLRRKTIGISYFGSSTHMVAEGILRYYGNGSGKDSQHNAERRRSGQVGRARFGADRGSTRRSEARRSTSLRRKKVTRSWSGQAIIKLPQNGLIATDKKIETSLDQAKRVKGTIEALQFIKNQKEEATDIFARCARVDREMAKAIVASHAAGYSVDGSMAEDALQAALQQACYTQSWRRKCSFLRSSMAGFWPRRKKSSD